MQMQREPPAVRKVGQNAAHLDRQLGEKQLDGLPVARLLCLHPLDRLAMPKPLQHLCEHDTLTLALHTSGTSRIQAS